jgi:hypothetical protein
VTLYFAYGSNMDPIQMEERCPGAVTIGPARLDDHRLVFVWDSPGWGGGVGHVERAPGEHVWGVLWDLTDDHIATLDRYEGVDHGVYERDTTVVMQNGVPVEATIYRALDPRPKDPSARYLNALIRGARAFAVPEEYVVGLRARLPEA